MTKTAASTHRVNAKPLILLPLSPEMRPLDALRPNPDNARRHPPEQIELFKRGILEFGWVTPLVVDATGMIRAGHGRFQAARELGLREIPCYRFEHLDENQLLAFELADNRIGQLAEDDAATVARKIAHLAKSSYDVTLTGYDLDAILAGVQDTVTAALAAATADEDPDEPGEPRKETPEGMRYPILIELTKAQVKRAREARKGAGFEDWNDFFLHLLDTAP